MRGGKCDRGAEGGMMSGEKGMDLMAGGSKMG